MTGRKLAVNVTTPDEDGRMVTFPAGTELPAEVAKQVTNPKAWGESDEDEKPAPKKPAVKRPSK